jgi:cell wall-associated NlpC family hydrolase
MQAAMLNNMLNLTPRVRSVHWSSVYVGKPWQLGAEGPDAFDCWGLARWVQREHYARELPQLRVAALRTSAGPEQTLALLELMRHSGWSRLTAWLAMEDGDLLRMQSTDGPHIGVVVRRSSSAVSVLQSVGGVDVQGRAHGAVEVAQVHQLVSEGFGHFQAWRWSA